MAQNGQYEDRLSTTTKINHTSTSKKSYYELGVSNQSFPTLETRDFNLRLTMVVFERGD